MQSGMSHGHLLVFTKVKDGHIKERDGRSADLPCALQYGKRACHIQPCCSIRRYHTTTVYITQELLHAAGEGEGERRHVIYKREHIPCKKEHRFISTTKATWSTILRQS